MPESTVCFTDSLIRRLLKHLVVIYTGVTAVVLLVYLGIGYVNTRDQVRTHLAAFHETFLPVIQEGLWRFDSQQWRLTVRGMLMSPFLTGIRIQNEFGEVKELAGTVEIAPGEPGFVNAADRKEVLAAKPRVFTTLYPETFDLEYQDRYLGNVTLYSCDTVVWEQVWRDFGGIAAAALLTTVALWTGLIWSGRRLLSRPLTALTEAVRDLDPERPDQKGVIHVAGPAGGEIRILEDAFNSLVDRLAQSVRERDAAEAENRRLVAAIEQADEMVLVADAAGRIRYANPALERSTGFSRDTLMKGPLSLLRPDEAGDQRLLAAVAEGKPFMDRQVHHRQDGTPFPVRVKASPIRNDGGAITHVVAVLHDMSHEMALEEQLRHSQKLEAIGTLSAGIAHDFNNILFPIILNAEMILKHLAPDDPNRRFSEGILKSARRARDLVRRILTFGRRDQHQGDVKDPFPLDAIVKESVQLLRATLPASIRIETAVETDGLIVNGDPSAVHQMLLNLCTNAYQAMEATGGVMTVGLCRVQISSGDGQEGMSDLPPGPYLRLSVTDTGPGIDAASLSRIFEPYFTTKAPGEGTGLGLAMVHGIAHHHGGTVTVDGRPGEGAVFTVYLPAAEPAAEPSMVGAADATGTAPTSSGREQLLVVDDDPPVAAALAQTLSELGYAVSRFTNPVAALAAFEAAPDNFNALLTDMTMPEMNGVELSARVHALRPRLPIILCTGVLGGVDGGALRRAGASVLLLKPVPAAHLAEVLRKVLDEGATPVADAAPSRDKEMSAPATRLLPAG